MQMLLSAALQVSAQQSAPSTTDTKNAKEAKGDCGLPYGKDHSLTFCPPDGRNLDTGIMNDQGIYAVFYPNGSSWNDAKESGTIMYINVVARAPGSTVADRMDRDAADAKHSSPATVVKQGEPIKSGDHSVPVLRFAPGAFARYEAVAYLGEEKVLVLFIIS